MKISTKSSNFIALLGFFLVYSSMCIHDENGLFAQEIGSYAVVDTGQLGCYDDLGELVTCPSKGEPFYGQDNQYDGNQPSYTDNGDGTVTDNVTGLMWQQSPDTDGDGDIDSSDKLTYEEAVAGEKNLSLGGYNDWRLPTIRELYSLIDFNGIDPSGYEETDTSGLIPFIDTSYFDFGYGDTDAGERIIDAQYASGSLYAGNTAGDGGDTLFGVNFADGRIKGYGLSLFGSEKTFFVIYVRGNTGYGLNDFENNGDGTVTDYATGLMWSQDDSGEGLNWENALALVEEKNAEKYMGYSDWRLPNAKELQSIVDYTRSPDSTSSAAIDPLFDTTSITNEAGQVDFPYYWSGTTHANRADDSGAYGAYVAFGRAMGYRDGAWVDVHGAGAQRSDPKAGDPAEFPTGQGPQGDAIRITNYVRLVRDAEIIRTPSSDSRESINQNVPVHMPTDDSGEAEALSASHFDNWLNGNIEGLSAMSDVEPSWSDVEQTFLSLVTAFVTAEEVDPQQYQPSAYTPAELTQEEMISNGDGNIFTIDTKGNISGITEKIFKLLR